MSKEEQESTLESTMVGPLWARAKYSVLYPEILEDPQAEIILNKVYQIY